MIGQNPSGKASVALYLWWALNIAIVLFVFLAFLFSTLSYTSHLNMANSVENHFEVEQGGLIEREYTVAQNFHVRRGAVTSFCDRDNAQLCEGLGPYWHMPFNAPNVLSPAELGVFAPLTTSASLYIFVLMSDHNTIHATYINTSANSIPGAKGFASYPVQSSVWGLQAHATSTPGVAVAMYTSANQTWLQVLTTTPSTGAIQFSPPQELFNIHDPNQNGTAIRTLVVAGDWIIVIHGYNHGSSTYQLFTIDGNQLTKLGALGPKQGSFNPQIVDVIGAHYLGNGYFFQSNANNGFLGVITFTNPNAPTINSVGTAEYYAHFNSLQIHSIGTPQATGGQLLLVGTQAAFEDDPLTISMFVEWKSTAPVLTVHQPTNLLGNQGRQPYFGQVSMCYLQPTEWEPYGGIFFSYIDAQDKRAKIVRARPVYTDWNLHLLPSPSLHISAHQYGRFNSFLVPTLHCNLATSPSHVLIAMQDFLPVFNTFTWHGGYRYAGIAQADQSAGNRVNVVRAGISQGYERLTPGFHYYIWNNGTIAPFQSVFELFTPNGNPFPVGTAIGEYHIRISDEILDFF